MSFFKPMTQAAKQRSVDSLISLDYNHFTYQLSTVMFIVFLGVALLDILGDLFSSAYGLQQRMVLLSSQADVGRFHQITWTMSVFIAVVCFLFLLLTLFRMGNHYYSRLAHHTDERLHGAAAMVIPDAKQINPVMFVYHEMTHWIPVTAMILSILTTDNFLFVIIEPVGWQNSLVTGLGGFILGLLVFVAGPIFLIASFQFREHSNDEYTRHLIAQGKMPTIEAPRQPRQNPLPPPVSQKSGQGQQNQKGRGIAAPPPPKGLPAPKAKDTLMGKITSFRSRPHDDDDGQEEDEVEEGWVDDEQEDEQEPLPVRSSPVRQQYPTRPPQPVAQQSMAPRPQPQPVAQQSKQPIPGKSGKKGVPFPLPPSPVHHQPSQPLRPQQTQQQGQQGRSSSLPPAPVPPPNEDELDVYEVLEEENGENEEEEEEEQATTVLGNPIIPSSPPAPAPAPGIAQPSFSQQQRQPSPVTSSIPPHVMGGNHPRTYRNGRGQTYYPPLPDLPMRKQ